MKFMIIVVTPQALDQSKLHQSIIVEFSIVIVVDFLVE